MSEVEANGADRRGVAQADADVVGVERGEIVKADARKDVAAVVERNNAQALLEGKRNAGFRVDDEELVAALGDVDLRAVGRRLVGAANPDVALRPGAVEGEAAKRIGAAGKEFFAEGNAAVGVGLR